MLVTRGRVLHPNDLARELEKELLEARSDLVSLLSVALLALEDPRAAHKALTGFLDAVKNSARIRETELEGHWRMAQILLEGKAEKSAGMAGGLDGSGAGGVR